LSELITSLLIALHLLAVNIAAAAPLVSIWHEWHDARGNATAGRAGKALLLMAIIATFVGAGLGLIVGWIIWQQGLSAVVQRLPSKIFYGVFEILFSFILTAIQLIWWHFSLRSPIWQRAVRMLLAFLAGTNLIYHFPVLFGVITELLHSGQLRGATIQSSEFRHQLIRGAVMARSVHFALAALATCGLALMIYGRSGIARLSDDERHRVAMWGGRWAVCATILQVPVGLWVITQLSTISQSRLMGTDLWCTGLFVLGLLTALWLAHVLASIAFGETSRRLVYRSVVLFVLVVILMTGASRRALAPMSSTSGTQVDESAQGN